ncbi:MAG: hypothetical protein GY765_14445, partial [bacterium]|nr:hypothetical protein [bacterium]
MNPLRRISIKNKLIIIILSVTILSIGAGFGFLLYHNINSYKEDMKNRVRSSVEVIGAFCVLPLEM